MRRRKPGFTLVELLVVIAIIGRASHDSGGHLETLPVRDWLSGNDGEPANASTASRASA